MKKAVFLVLGPALVMLLSGGLPGCASASGRQSEAQAYYDQGNQYLNQKNYDQAIETFNAALKINPKFADAYFNRGNA